MNNSHAPRHIATAVTGEVKDLWQPTRILELSTSSDESSTTIRLLETRGGYFGPYVALSYSWGGSSNYKLERGNVAQLTGGVPTHNLPKNLRDATEVTIKLGLIYIWIDSLCIKQDSTEDWEDEAIRMHKVYQCAEITLSASASKTNEDGLFFETQRCLPNTVHSLELPGLAVSDYGIVDSCLWDNNIAQGPLICKAWTVQERMLSKRLVHFGREQVFFQCARGLECESYPSDFARYGADQYNPHGFTLRDTSGDLGDRSYNQCAIHIRIALRCRELDQFQTIWSRIVRTYSSCQMTFQTDKLLEIGSLAKRLQTWRGSEYYAGLWEDSLIFRLCWWVPTRSQANGEPSKRHDEYVAPSWSWASVIGVVELGTNAVALGQGSITLLAKIEQVEIQKQGVSSFGQIRGGHLMMTGQVKPIVIRKTSPESSSPYDVQHNHEVMSSRLSNTLTIRFDTCPGATAQRVSFMPLWLRAAPHYGYDGGIENDMINGLLLTSLPAETRQYSRVGIMDISRAEYERLWGKLRKLTHVSEVSRTLDGSDIAHEGLETVIIV